MATCCPTCETTAESAPPEVPVSCDGHGGQFATTDFQPWLSGGLVDHFYQLRANSFPQQCAGADATQERERWREAQSRRRLRRISSMLSILKEFNATDRERIACMLFATASGKPLELHHLLQLSLICARAKKTISHRVESITSPSCNDNGEDNKPMVGHGDPRPLARPVRGPRPQPYQTVSYFTLSLDFLPFLK